MAICSYIRVFDENVKWWNFVKICNDHAFHCYFKIHTSALENSWHFRVEFIFWIILHPIFSHCHHHHRKRSPKLATNLFTIIHNNNRLKAANLKSSEPLQLNSIIIIIIYIPKGKVQSTAQTQSSRNYPFNYSTSIIHSQFIAWHLGQPMLNAHRHINTFL